MIPVFKVLEKQPAGTASDVLFQNLICFLMNFGTECLRQLAYSTVKKEDFVKLLSSEKIAAEVSQLMASNRLTQKQFQMLTDNLDPQSFEISLLMILLTNENIFQLPDKTVIHDLKCLREIRGGILHHSKLYLSKTLFEGYLQQMSGIFKRIINHVNVEKQPGLKLKLKNEKYLTRQNMQAPDNNSFLSFINWHIQDTDNYQSSLELLQLKTTTGASTMDESPSPTGRAAGDSMDDDVVYENHYKGPETSLVKTLEDITENIIMEVGDQRYENIESVTRSESEDDNEDNLKVTNEPHDAKFFGFNDLGLYVFRVCRPDEEISTGIVCKDPSSKRTIEQHVAFGVKYDSKYIATTTSLDVASYYAFYDMGTKERSKRQLPLRVVKIDLNVLKGTDIEKGCINLTKKEVRDHFIKGATHRNWVMSSQTVLFTDKIPKYINGKPVYALVNNLVCLSHPPRTKRKKMKTDDLVEELVTEVQKTTTGADLEDKTPLLTEWATGISPDGRVFFVNHDTRTATWAKPMNQ